MSEHQYLQLLSDVYERGEAREYRNGVRHSLFGRQIYFNLQEGFPLLTTKRVWFKGIAAELLWFLSGSTNAKVLEDQGVNIWKEWGDPVTRELGPVYGSQWRNFNGVDQITKVIDSIENDPYGTRHVVSAWNPAEVSDMALPPCHAFFQFYVSKNGGLSCHLYQRSADIFLGVPFNIASYALLTHLVARECHLNVNELIISFGDVHLYDNHKDAAKEQLRRRPGSMPVIGFRTDKDIFNISIDDIELLGYYPASKIEAEVSA